MKNLAGVATCDEVIRKELETAGIPVIPGSSHGEVPYSIYGKLGRFTFKRAWYYWVVDGPTPIKVALAMYANPRGVKAVRVDGNCGCPPPDPYSHGGIISSYHIDTQDGLNFFVESIMPTVTDLKPLSMDAFFKLKVGDKVMVYYAKDGSPNDIRINHETLTVLSANAGDIVTGDFDWHRTQNTVKDPTSNVYHTGRGDAYFYEATDAK
jgi:hypothetical protein